MTGIVTPVRLVMVKKLVMGDENQPTVLGNSGEPRVCSILNKGIAACIKVGIHTTIRQVNFLKFMMIAYSKANGIVGKRPSREMIVCIL